MNNTGPAKNMDEARELTSLLTHEHGKTMLKYLERVKETAITNLKRRNQTAEDQGYYKGIIQVVEDVEGLPLALQKQLRGGNNERRNGST